MKGGNVQHKRGWKSIKAVLGSKHVKQHFKGM
jgi:hypothetical protein